MAQPIIQHSFNSGEWAPSLWARSDLEKYGSGAALLRNFFIDYRGGASTRSGTRYIIRGYKDSTAIRLIPFQAAISLGFVLEFGDAYIRFHRNGAPVLEAGLAITGATQANPCVITVANTYTTGSVDWVYITGVAGMTQLNGKYFIVTSRTGANITIADLFGNPVDSTAFGTYTSGGTTQRVYTIASPYAAADLALLKFVENVDVLVLTHPDYVPYTLTFATATSWTLAPIVFGATSAAPNNVAATQHLLSAGTTTFYAYLVTTIDSEGEESPPSTIVRLGGLDDMRVTAGSITISWDPVPGAIGYNVYKASLTKAVPVPVGAFFGFIGTVTGTSLNDFNITADFSKSPPEVDYPYATGYKVDSVTITTPGSYTTVPTVSFAAPPSGVTALGSALLGALTVTIAGGGAGYAVGNTIAIGYGITLTVATEAGGAITGVTITAAGSTSIIPSNPLAQVSTSGSGAGASFNVTAWKVVSIAVTNGGWGYVLSPAPAITFSSGAAAATANMALASHGNPAVPTFFQQRLVLGGPSLSPSTINFSQPGFYFNNNISNPVQEDNAITITVVTGQLTNIKAFVPQPGGLIVLTDGISFLINGGSLGSAITPTTITANPQSYIGANDMPPIVVNFDILSVPAKGSSVRDNTYNFQTNVFAGQDISIISSHLFFGYTLLEWAWAEEPYKIVWAVRNDGTLLSLTFIKEQEFIAWAHHDTEDDDASFLSTCSIVEAASSGFQNYTYFVVGRTIGATPVKYIEYFPERGVSADAQDYTTVDCSISYSGAPATSFQGGEFLAGKTCTGLADGGVITPFVMPASGNFTLPVAKSEVTVGLAFECDLKPLPLDVGNPTIQSKMKKINAGTLRVVNALGLQIGTDEANLVDMKDLVVGNVGSMTNEVVAGLVTGDVRTFLDPKWQEIGQYYIRQDKPFPATILAVIPQLSVGDTPK